MVLIAGVGGVRSAATRYTITKNETAKNYGTAHADWQKNYPSRFTNHIAERHKGDNIRWWW